MKTLNCTTSACRHCRFYKPEGRRGGYCQQLSAPVQGFWKACSLAIPPFAPSWENLGENINWREEALTLPTVLTLKYSQFNSPLTENSSVAEIAAAQK